MIKAFTKNDGILNTHPPLIRKYSVIFYKLYKRRSFWNRNEYTEVDLQTLLLQTETRMWYAQGIPVPTLLIDGQQLSESSPSNLYTIGITRTNPYTYTCELQWEYWWLFMMIKYLYWWDSEILHNHHWLRSKVCIISCWTHHEYLQLSFLTRQWYILYNTPE